ncbi:winged helix-turn-helix domain-containing protein [Haloarcula sp. JP-L23]|uniref:helix-turn-helix transcriptional regulator n=1 Tax=Haloarcula sp. JP-L23 TaxID=2716717 RepID=UPI00140F23B0|nr:DUF1724 domain-containing protein [Haloarcula sp. JP-L23]
MGTDSLVSYVGSSSVRSDVVDSLHEQPRPTDALLSTLNASESAVYDALSNLESRGLVTETPDGWRLTGSGRLVGDTLERQRATDRLLATNPCYWERHDTSVLPQAFRCRLPQLGAYEVIERAEHDLRGLVPWVVSKVDAVESCEIISPMYHREYQEVMPDNADSRLLVGQHVVDDVLLEMDEGPFPRTYDETPVRVSSVPFALGVSEEWVILTLPDHDGHWPDAKVFSTADSAVQWGRALFDAVWKDGTPLPAYLSDE